MEQIESLPNESRPRPKLSLIALILSLSSILYCSTTIGIFFLFGEYVHYGPAGLLAVCTSCLGVLAPLAGMVIGGVALARKETDGSMAMIAIALGILAVTATGFIGFFTLLVCCTAM